MKYDIAGFVVKKGNIVLVCCKDGGNNLLHAKVVKETKQSLMCELFDCPDGYKWLEGKVVRRKPEQLIVISNF